MSLVEVLVAAEEEEAEEESEEEVAGAAARKADRAAEWETSSSIEGCREVGPALGFSLGMVEAGSTVAAVAEQATPLGRTQRPSRACLHEQKAFRPSPAANMSRPGASMRSSALSDLSSLSVA
jgi:hypothetical protein